MSRVHNRLRYPPSDENDALFDLKLRQISMLKVQGYVISSAEEDIIPRSFGEYYARKADFVQMYSSGHSGELISRENMDMTYIHGTNDKLVKHVIFMPDGMGNSAAVNGTDIGDALSAEKFHDYRDMAADTLIITRAKVTKAVMASTKNMDSRVKFVIDSSVPRDPLNHSHTSAIITKVGNREKEDLFGGPGMEGMSIPVITPTDPLCVYRGYKLGDVVRIVRHEITTDVISTTMTYRKVAFGPPPIGKADVSKR